MPTKLTTVSYAPNSNVRFFLNKNIFSKVFLHLLKSIVVGTNDGNLWVYVVKNPPSSNNVSTWIFL